VRIISALRFLFYPLPLLILANIICLTHVLRAKAVTPAIIVAIDLIPIALPIILFYTIITAAKRQVSKQFRDQSSETE